MTGPQGERLHVMVHGHSHAVSAALLRAELQRDGPPPKLPTLEAILVHAPREQAIVRLSRMLDHPVPAGGEPLAMRAALGLLGLSPAPSEPGGEGALRALTTFADRTGGQAGATLRAGVVLLTEGPAALCRSGVDPLLVRQSPRAIAVLRQPGPLVPALRPLCNAWMAALDEAARSKGAHAHRGLLGDVCEAIYRLLQRGQPQPQPGDLLDEAARSTLLDTITFELPGTADFLAARAMVWLLGALGPPDDAAVAAIERARDRFANEEFHADCAAILSGEPWPPGPPR